MARRERSAVRATLAAVPLAWHESLEHLGAAERACRARLPDRDLLARVDGGRVTATWGEATAQPVSGPVAIEDYVFSEDPAGHVSAVPAATGRREGRTPRRTDVRFHTRADGASRFGPPLGRGGSGGDSGPRLAACELGQLAAPALAYEVFGFRRGELVIPRVRPVVPANDAHEPPGHAWADPDGHASTIVVGKRGLACRRGRVEGLSHRVGDLCRSQRACARSALARLVVRPVEGRADGRRANST
jgi:hypothetical protein